MKPMSAHAGFSLPLLLLAAVAMPIHAGGGPGKRDPASASR
jgi:hypothetical protein